MTTYVTVCKNVILSNLKHGDNNPPIRVSRGKYDKHPTKKHEFRYGNVTIKCDMENPLPWGARVWIEIEEPHERISGV
jgi:hypothetical protein